MPEESRPGKCSEAQIYHSRNRVASLGPAEKKIAKLTHYRALRKIGFEIVRHGRHVVMSNGISTVTLPRANPINAYTMGTIAKAAGLTPEQFKQLL